MTKEQRKRLAAIRAVAPLAVPPQPDHPVDKIEEAGDNENPPPLRSGDSSNI